MNYVIRDAVPADSGKLIELTSLAPMKGVIGLKIDRQPDFFSLLNLSDSYIMLVAENDEKQLTGCFAATKNNMGIDGRESMVYYLRDLKIHPDHKSSMLAYYLVKKMYKRLLEEGADILCCTMASGNDAVMPFFKGRVGIPAFSTVADYNVYQILPAFVKGNKLMDLQDTTLLAAFLNERYQSFSIQPHHVSRGELKDCINFSHENNNGVEAAIAAFDPSPYKQNIVMRYSFSLAVMLFVMRFFKLFFKFPAIPGKNVPLRILYAKYYTHMPGKEQALKNLIKQVRHYAHINNYHLVAIAADEKDIEMNKLLKPLSRFVFKSSLLVTSLQNNEGLILKMKQGVCYEDYSLV